MTVHQPSSSRALQLCIALTSFGVLAAGAWGLHLHSSQASDAPWLSARMLLAPMIGVSDVCLQLHEFQESPGHGTLASDLIASCTGPSGSAAALIESTLSPLDSNQKNIGPFALGYSLAVPLMQLFRSTPTGWEIDTDRVARVVRTIEQTERPVILYLFSTHFASNAPIEEVLSKDPANLAQTRDGPIRAGSYYGAPVYNWSVARTDNSITQRREQAIQAVLDAACLLTPSKRARIRGVTLLGELHQMVPGFEAGMGYEGAYRITDYSEASILGFQAYLQSQFGDIAQFNRAMGTHFSRFGEVSPPSRNIRTEPLGGYTEHIDAFAHGTLPIAGWAFLPREAGAPAPWVQVYLDGERIGRVRADRSRQDVLAALPELRKAETGWRMDLDFRGMAHGLHRIDVLLEQSPERLTTLGTRYIAIMDAHQSAPLAIPMKGSLPATVPAAEGLLAHVDQPMNHADYYFNPLVPWWHAFRNEQVASYLKRFASMLKPSCFGDVPLFTHQILPFNASGRDPNKLAVDASLSMSPVMEPGVSLYGDNAYGPTFRDWRAAHSARTYGVVEFHPMFGMPRSKLESVFQRHSDDGAQFLSFFMEPRWHGRLVARDNYNPFAFDPDNEEFGSNVLYRSLQQLLSAPSHQKN